FAQIAGMLEAEGSLLIVEDMQPHVGELPGRSGYLLLDLVALKLLFDAKAEREASVREVSSERDGRLKVFSVDISALRRVTAQTIVGALTAVRDDALSRIEKLRESNDRRSFQAGRLHALYSILHTNAVLSLKPYQAT